MATCRKSWVSWPSGVGWWLVADGWHGGGMVVGPSQDLAGFSGDPLKLRNPMPPSPFTSFMYAVILSHRITFAIQINQNVGKLYHTFILSI